MGRNAALRAVIGVAFGANSSHVVLPADPPNRNFDFLVTTADKQNESLQAAIRKKFGYVAQREVRDTPVLALKVVDASLPGLAKSADGGKPSVNFMDYEIQFTFRPVADVAQLLNRNLPTPVINKTDLTDRYDFKIRWNSRIQQRMHNGEIDREGVNQMLAGLGLGLEPDTAPLEMLVVKKAK